MSTKSAVLTLTMGLAVVANGLAISQEVDGNRYNRDRLYHSEISSSEAYLKTKPGSAIFKRLKGKKRPIIIDVRSMEEFAAGHPIGSYNIPFPRVCSGCDRQLATTFYDEVYDLVKGDLDREILLLCRTGSRSVDAGNILADPEDDAGLERKEDNGDYVPGGLPFTNVKNIWEGFVGQPKYAYSGGSPAYDIDEDGNIVFFPLDLNNNGIIDADSADVYEERADKNEDKDGWRNFLALPWTTKFHWRQAYMQNPWEYRNLNLTPVE